MEPRCSFGFKITWSFKLMADSYNLILKRMAIAQIQVLSPPDGDAMFFTKKMSSSHK